MIVLPQCPVPVTRHGGPTPQPSRLGRARPEGFPFPRGTHDGRHGTPVCPGVPGRPTCASPAKAPSQFSGMTRPQTPSASPRLRGYEVRAIFCPRGHSPKGDASRRPSPLLRHHNVRSRAYQRNCCLRAVSSSRSCLRGGFLAYQPRLFAPIRVSNTLTTGQSYLYKV